jgi:hypothetical protein
MVLRAFLPRWRGFLSALPWWFGGRVFEVSPSQIQGGENLIVRVSAETDEGCTLPRPSREQVAIRVSTVMQGGAQWALSLESVLIEPNSITATARERLHLPQPLRPTLQTNDLQT